jgi:steroid 5-alpha reductase family enzyme
MNPFIITIVSAIAVNGIFFAYAAVKKTDVVTDLSYSLSFALVCLILILANSDLPIIAHIPAALTILWAVRLGSYLFGRIIKTKVDHRFDQMRDLPLKFAKFWILQALAVIIILFPVVASIARPDATRSFGFFELLGVLLWGVGFLIETVADMQKSRFKDSQAGGFITTGLWKYSRHPNYFGETLLWWALFFYAIPSLSGWLILSILGPVFITLLLLFVSGIPLLEKSADAKYSNDPLYREYKRKTSIFIPLPPQK